MGKFKTIEMRINGEKDFKMTRKSVVVRNRRVVPDSIVEVEMEEVDEGTGEVKSNVVEAKCTLTRDQIEDARGFIKHRRFRGLVGLSGRALALYCYMLEKCDSWGHVHLDWFEIEEYIGCGQMQQFTPIFRKLIDKSLIKRVKSKEGQGWCGKWGHYQVLGVSKRKEEENDKKLGRFVKVYNPRAMCALSRGGMMLLCYIMDHCGYDGLVHLKADDFLKYTQEYGGQFAMKTPKSFFDARADLLSEKINILKPLYDLVEKEGKVKYESIEGWYRISPNVCFVGNRAEAGYEVGEEYC